MADPDSRLSATNTDIMAFSASGVDSGPAHQPRAAASIIVRVEVEVSPGPSSDRAASRARLSGADAGEMIAAIEAYQTAGVEHIVLALNSGDVDKLKATMEGIARDVLPHFS